MGGVVVSGQENGLSLRGGYEYNPCCVTLEFIFAILYYSYAVSYVG